jgi:uncharacterized delta-60 repeat protein
MALCTPVLLKAQSGALDPSFNGTGTAIYSGTNGDNAQKILVQPDQKVLVIGMSFDDNYISRAYVIRYLPNGTLDTDFANNGVFTYELDYEANLYSAVLTPEGKIILAGSTTDYLSYKVLLIKLNANGSLDNSFAGVGVVAQRVSLVVDNAEDIGFDVTLDANNNILVCGSSTGADYEVRPVVLRFTPNGALDTSFGTNGVATIPTLEWGSDFKGIVVQPDGKIVATGAYGSGLLWWVLLVVRFEADGSLDTSFGNGGVVKYNYSSVDDEADDLALLSDGSILVAGFTASQTYNFSALLVKFTPNGFLDDTFGNAGVVAEDLDDYDQATNVAVLSDGTIVMSGTSGEGPPGSFDLAVWKYLANGTRDPGFGTNGLVQHYISPYNTMIYGMGVQADGKILLCGQARTPENLSSFFTARLQNEVSISIAELSGSGYAEAFPNPATVGATVTLRVPETVSPGARVGLYTTDGRLVSAYADSQLRRTTQGIEIELPEGLARGMYQLVFEQKDLRLASTIVIAH